VRHRVKSRGLFLLFAALGTSLTVFAVICRIMSGVHWISDIIGGALISLSLVLTYRALIKTPMKINTGAVLSEKL
jgi:undecaprenyl-diphosphatase